nr:hypothetical protein [Tanacetum cinerariifolium]
MSRDVLTVGSAMRIPLLYRGEYLQWVERFMNYLEEQTDGEALINSIKNEWKQYATMMRQNKNLMDINIDTLYNILKQNQGDVNNAMGSKTKTIVVTSDPLALIAEKTKKKTIVVTSDLLAFIAEKTNVSRSKEKVRVSLKSEGSEADDFSELKNITALLAKAFNRRKFYSKPTNNNLRTSSSYQSANKKQEKGIGFENPSYFEKAKDLRPTLYVEKVIGLGYTLMFLTHSDEALEIEKFKRSRENKIEFAYDYGNLNASYVNEKINLEDDYFQEIINPDFDKIDSSFQQTSSLKPYVLNVILEKIIIDLEDEVVSLLENQTENDCLVVEKEYDKEENPKTVHMIMPSKDNLYNGRKGIGFKNPSYFEKAKDLRPTIYDEKVIGLGYTPMFLTHSDEPFDIKKFKRSRENKIEFAYDYGNLNASYVNEKINLEDDYFQEIINPDFDKIDSPFQQTSSLKPYVPDEILEKIIIDLEDEVVNLLEKEKVNLETIESLKLKSF